MAISLVIADSNVTVLGRYIRRMYVYYRRQSVAETRTYTIS